MSVKSSNLKIVVFALENQVIATIPYNSSKALWEIPKSLGNIYSQDHLFQATIRVFKDNIALHEEAFEYSVAEKKGSWCCCCQDDPASDFKQAFIQKIRETARKAFAAPAPKNGLQPKEQEALFPKRNSGLNQGNLPYGTTQDHSQNTQLSQPVAIPQGSSHKTVSSLAARSLQNKGQSLPKNWSNTSVNADLYQTSARGDQTSDNTVTVLEQNGRFEALP
jgi:hypothetical protein